MARRFDVLIERDEEGMELSNPEFAGIQHVTAAA